MYKYQKYMKEYKANKNYHIIFKIMFFFLLNPYIHTFIYNLRKLTIHIIIEKLRVNIKHMKEYQKI